MILATPLIESFHKDDKDCKIDVLVRKGSETLFTGHPFVRNVLVWNKEIRKHAGMLNLLKDIRHTKYDYVINLQRFASTGFITAFSSSPNRIGFEKNPFSFLFSRKVPHVIGKDAKVHEVDRNLSLLKGIVTPLRKVKLYPTEKDFLQVVDFKLGKYICIAPGSLWMTKRYSPEKWAIFINSLPKDMLVYLIGSKEDVDLCNKIKEMSVTHSCFILAGKLTLLETAALMHDALMNFSNDSAPQHLASAMNAPVTTVFCSTVPAFGFGPLSDKSFIVETCEKLTCRPCGLHGYKTCPEKHFKCCETITNEQLLCPT